MSSLCVNICLLNRERKIKTLTNFDKKSRDQIERPIDTISHARNCSIFDFILKPLREVDRILKKDRFEYLSSDPEWNAKGFSDDKCPDCGERYWVTFTCKKVCLKGCEMKREYNEWLKKNGYKAD